MVNLPFKNTIFDWFRNFLSFIGLKDNREKLAEFRTIYINTVNLDNPSEKPIKYASNSIKTSKYNIINFFPKNLFEQFRRIANFYFLVNAIIIFVVPDPPTSPWTSILPLLFVVIVTGVKQAYEDILKHKSDRQINNAYVRILRDGMFQDKKWKDVKVGDIVEVTADQPFPCDLALLYSKTEDGICYITTANLDGETNLKQRTVPRNLSDVDLDTEQKLSNFKAVINCDKPNLNLYEFKGKFLIGQNQFPITNENILLRGSCLRIAPVIYACAIYTGKDTKVMLNSKFRSNKFSCIEKKLNLFILIFLVLLAVLTFLCFGLSFIDVNIYNDDWYLSGLQPSYYSNRTLFNFIIFVYYMSLLNYIVPLSMYVTIELQRFVGSQFIEWDLQLYDKKTDQCAKANTSDLNEDLGQVEYLFSDKTGTLTENEMLFKQFCVNDSIYEEKSGQLYILNTASPVQIERDPDLVMFLECLVLCHTVEYNATKTPQYQASSPDELAFVLFARKLGIVYLGDLKTRTNKIRRINFRGRIREFEIKQILEFDSTRKKMSIILRDLSSQNHLVFVKGADSSVLKECLMNSRQHIQSCEESITYFGQNGWRTLAFAYKVLAGNEYARSEQLLLDAFNDIMNRDEKVANAYASIESNLVLLGATGIEDKLQDDVEITLEVLRYAGIKIWVLTGDKTETAINISYSCRHFSKTMDKMFLIDLIDIAKIRTMLEIFDQKTQETLRSVNKSFALIVDGKSLGLIYEHDLEYDFREIAMRCNAVLCCRMTPAQKAQIVRLVKKSKKKPITAAIGDGANDVSMIQEAHIGLGIFGKEGRNAAKSSDFCFAKFKFVKRLFFVHGYLYYTRASILVQYFFYKNMAFVICQVYFAFWNAFSVTSLYGSIVLTVFNITLTSAPILLFGLFEQKNPIKKIENSPALYRTIAKNKLLSIPEFCKWMALGVWHSLVAYFFTYFLHSATASFQGDGKMDDIYQFGAIVITIIFVLVHVKLLTEWHYLTYFTLFGFGLSLLAFVLFLIIPNAFIMPSLLSSLTDYQSTYWIYFNMLSNISVWLLLFLAIAAAVVPDFAMTAISNFREIRKITRNYEKIKKEKLNEDEIDHAEDFDQNMNKNVNNLPAGNNRRRFSINRLQENNSNSVMNGNYSGGGPSYVNKTFAFDEINQVGTGSELSNITPTNFSIYEPPQGYRNFVFDYTNPENTDSTSTSDFLHNYNPNSDNGGVTYPVNLNNLKNNESYVDNRYYKTVVTKVDNDIYYNTYV